MEGKPQLPQQLDREQIEEILPHRNPMLLVDKVIYWGDLTTDGFELVAELFVTNLHCAGHFPDQEIFPGFHTAEALAQAAGLLYALKYNSIGSNQIGVLVSVRGLKWRRMVLPGQTLVLKVRIEKIRGQIVVFNGVALVDNHVATNLEEGMFSLINTEEVR